MAGRLLLLAAPMVVFSSCASAPGQTDIETTAAIEKAAAEERSREWESATRERADQSMAEAQHLAAEGLREDALASTD